MFWGTCFEHAGVDGEFTCCPEWRVLWPEVQDTGACAVRGQKGFSAQLSSGLQHKTVVDQGS